MVVRIVVGAALSLCVLTASTAHALRNPEPLPVTPTRLSVGVAELDEQLREVAAALDTMADEREAVIRYNSVAGFR